ncbi:hypothetical protein SAY86_030017 [Trapa natans]|uniref:NPH3 domain-containing protein n=1 Tax=Trapa natans TaxID=22666 RepID=A0AAN7MME8_TRANT|nr:hypothetical protein SAY86_030017 [Trapa natans]
MPCKTHMEPESSMSLKFKPNSSTASFVQLMICDEPFMMDLELLAAKSEKIASLFEDKNYGGKVSCALRDIPTDTETFKIVARFCHGLDPQLSAENVIPLICLASHLRMTENLTPNNLLSQALDFFESRILPSWNETLRALRMSEKVLQQAASLGLIDACLESIVAKVMIDPRLLGKPVKSSRSESCNGEEEDDEVDEFKPNARRKLFVDGWQLEDLAALPVHFYEPIMNAIKLHGVPLEYVAASLCAHMTRWVGAAGFSEGEESISFHKRNSQREAIEAIERLLPHEKGLLPCPVLFQMLRYSISLEARCECRDGLEGRIGRQLDQAKVKDLLIPCEGYAKEGKYNIGSVKRILKNFYSNCTSSDLVGITRVADLMEDFLAEAAADRDLDVNKFVSLAEMSTAASLGNDRSSDGIYKAVDIFLDRHGYLTDSEREEACRVLDCRKMSQEACRHAAQNERLPLRVVVQVLFMEQLKLRETVTKEICNGEIDSTNYNNNNNNNRLTNESEEDEGHPSCREEELRGEMVRMNNKVMELERKCGIMKKEIETSGNNGKDAGKKHKLSMWVEIKRKFGCVSSVHDYKCQVQKKKKVHPRRMQ